MPKNLLSSPLSTLLAGAVLSLAAAGAMAQTPAPATTNPATVGVTPQDAAEANRKAVPRADTGTLVRTDETAADKARDAMDNTADRANRAADRARDAMDNTADRTNRAADNARSSMTNNDASRSTRNTRAAQRRARADRN